MNQLHLKQENAPCTAACSQGDPARAVRAVCFDNQVLGARLFAACSEADLEAAEKACIHYDRPVRLREIAKSLPAPTPETDLPSLEIDFCGLHCENPFFLASSAICTNYEMVAAALEAGWAGVFYKTICLQEIQEVYPGGFSPLRRRETGRQQLCRFPQHGTAVGESGGEGFRHP